MSFLSVRFLFLILVELLRIFSISQHVFVYPRKIAGVGYCFALYHNDFVSVVFFGVVFILLWSSAVVLQYRKGMPSFFIIISSLGFCPLLFPFFFRASAGHPSRSLAHFGVINLSCLSFSKRGAVQFSLLFFTDRAQTSH